MLTELKEMRKQNKDFRNETKIDISGLKQEIQNVDKELEKMCLIRKK